MTQTYKLSPSTLSLYLECPRCFWLSKNRNIGRPRGIFPSLPGGMDRVIKTYYDECRRKGTLPEELKALAPRGVSLFRDQARLDLWRNWKTGLAYRNPDRNVLFGAIDDLLVMDSSHIPFDYKTKGSPSSEESAVKYYRHQMDCYAFLLEANGMKTTGFAFLLFYSPREAEDGGKVAFEVQPIRIETDPARAQKVFEDALVLLKADLPVSSSGCEYCTWLRHFKTPFK